MAAVAKRLKIKCFLLEEDFKYFCFELWYYTHFLAYRVGFSPWRLSRWMRGIIPRII